MSLAKPRSLPLLLAVLLFASPVLVGLPLPAAAQPLGHLLGNHKDERPMTRLRIEVTAGDDNQPVAEASVYVKFDGDLKSEKSKQIELNLKTSQKGIAQSPAVPQGKILIQIIAPGWKTYGEWFDIKESEQTIRIHLLPTTKWY